MIGRSQRGHPGNQRQKQLSKCGLGISKAFSKNMQDQNHFYKLVKPYSLFHVSQRHTRAFSESYMMCNITPSRMKSRYEIHLYSINPNTKLFGKIKNNDTFLISFVAVVGKKYLIHFYANM